MQTLTQGYKERRLMANWAEEQAQQWRELLATDSPGTNPATKETIIRWLLGEDLGRYETATPEHLVIARQAMDYRYRIFRQRYFNLPPERCYRNLIQRLGSLAVLRNKIRTWVALSRDRQRAVVDVLEEVIQELLHSDRYIQQQIAWIHQCTANPRLRNSLLLATVEEYCLRPIRSQPLLAYRFVNYLRRSQRGGITHVPEGDLVKLVSEEISPDESDAPLSLLDNKAVDDYQESQAAEEQQVLRQEVKQEFTTYLLENLGPEAQKWLQLYLQGKSQEAIAQSLQKDIKYIYRLREKISYHAIRVFGLKTNSELVASWLQTSLRENNLGLPPSQWDRFLASLTPEENQLVERLKAGESIEAIAKELKLKTNQVMSDWSKIYLAALELRGAS
ncbi:MAG: HetZ-related protein 2 [Cyanosarcina radialis HA8281-LM2]|nr:HetZ-related protein 2 [Cyanosarcina radialis HA8281-LM2]